MLANAETELGGASKWWRSSIIFRARRDIPRFRLFGILSRPFPSRFDSTLARINPRLEDFPTPEQISRGLLNDGYRPTCFEQNTLFRLFRLCTLCETWFLHVFLQTLAYPWVWYFVRDIYKRNSLVASKQRRTTPSPKGPKILVFSYCPSTRLSEHNILLELLE
jgi:hypothetical protein